MTTKTRLSTREAAECCGLAPRTLEKYRIVGGGPAYFKIGRRVVYDRDDLDAWLASQRRRSTADSAEICRS